MKSVIHPIVTGDVNGVKARALIDTGAGSSYICTNLIRKLDLKLLRRERRLIEQMYGTVEKLTEIYKVKIASFLLEDFRITVPCIDAEIEVLTYLPNPNIPGVKGVNSNLKIIQFADENVTKYCLPFHVILGVADYQKIKTSEPSIFGKHPGRDPFAEFTKLGWTLAGKQCVSGTFSGKQFFVRSSKEEFEQSVL